MKQDERFAEAAGHEAERMTNLLGDLIARPSLSRREDAVVQRIASEMTDLGFDEVRVDGFGSVIGRIGDGPVHIAYDSHIDVVDVGDPASWKTEPFSPVIEGRT